MSGSKPKQRPLKESQDFDDYLKIHYTMQLKGKLDDADSAGRREAEDAVRRGLAAGSMAEVSRTEKTANRKMADGSDLTPRQRTQKRKTYKRKPGTLERDANRHGPEKVGSVYSSNEYGDEDMVEGQRRDDRIIRNKNARAEDVLKAHSRKARGDAEAAEGGVDRESSRQQRGKRPPTTTTAKKQALRTKLAVKQAEKKRSHVIRPILKAKKAAKARSVNDGMEYAGVWEATKGEAGMSPEEKVASRKKLGSKRHDAGADSNKSGRPVQKPEQTPKEKLQVRLAAKQKTVQGREEIRNNVLRRRAGQKGPHKNTQDPPSDYNPPKKNNRKAY